MVSDFRTLFARHWFAILFLVAYGITGLLIAFGYPQYYQYTMLVFFIALVPTILTMILAVPFVYHLLRIHKLYYTRIHGRIFDTTAEYIYKPDTIFPHNPPRLRTVAISTVITVFGIISIVVSITGINSSFFKGNAGIDLLIVSLLPAIFFAPSINISSWLLTRAGVMFENRSDGMRVNIGNEMRRNLQFIVGPIAIWNFIRAMNDAFHDAGIILSFVLLTLTVSAPSAVVTILLLRKKVLKDLSIKLNDKLKECNF